MTYPSMSFGCANPPLSVLQLRHTAESIRQLQPLQQAAKSQPSNGHQPRLNGVANSVLGQAPPRQMEHPLDCGSEHSRDSLHSKITPSRQQKRPAADAQV